MKVTLLGHTRLTAEACAILEKSSPGVSDIDHMAEIAGRRCYRSEHRPRATTATNPAYLRNVIDQGHTSVLTHAHATFLVEDVTRFCTHELIRSVFLGYSQESTRYVVPPLDVAPVIPADADEDDAASLVDGFHRGMAEYRTRYERAIDRGLSPKRAAGLARHWMPQTVPTSLVVSGNMRAWRDLLAQRATPHAEVEIRTLALELLSQLRWIAQNTFADITPEASA